VIGMERSPTSATGTTWERTPWHATQWAAWQAVEKASGWRLVTYSCESRTARTLSDR
jgi:hypothetical protein